MFQLLLVFSCALVAIQGASLKTSNHVPTGRIIGGKPGEIKDSPWQVNLHDYSKFYCGGSILSENYVLTAASCVDGKESEISTLTVRTGNNKISDGDISKVSSIQIHPQYDSLKQTFDVAVVKLLVPLPFTSSAMPVALYADEAPIYNSTATIAGWGPLHQDDPATSDALQTLDVKIIKLSDCQDAFFPLRDVTDHMTCTGAVATSGYCNEDNGGALTIEQGSRRLQVGVASYKDIGDGCLSEKYPAVYIRLSAPVIRNFINSATNGEASWR